MNIVLRPLTRFTGCPFLSSRIIHCWLINYLGKKTLHASSGLIVHIPTPLSRCLALVRCMYCGGSPDTSGINSSGLTYTRILQFQSFPPFPQPDLLCNSSMTTQAVLRPLHSVKREIRHDCNDRTRIPILRRWICFCLSCRPFLLWSGSSQYLLNPWQ